MTPPPPVLCSQAARDSGDDPAGTAAQFGSFVLLDHRASWTANTAEDAVAQLDPAVAEAIGTRNGLRAFAIRSVHSRRIAEAGRSFLGVVGPNGFVAALDGAVTTADLTDLDTHRTQARPQPVFAVCTNGRRDRCCAIVGRGVATGLHQEFGETIVEISHLGGHRYAGTMLVLPWGYAYGFLDLAGARAVVTAAADGLVHPDGLRGRADLPPAAQTADVLLRRELGPAATDAVRIRAVPAQHGDHVTVEATVHDEAVTVHLRREHGPAVHDTLCGGKPFATGRWVRD
ncbi:hypothetical protein ABIB25_000425 [Nakamurella sp. UYEF19]|uniref:sucrase ferredoxin n=1 Tax=Nakamurella sp. UYEF19 TaxID=1756392 RepID=UPI00339904E7